MSDQDCTGWWTGNVTCQLCGFEWVGVWCDCADTKALQCARCKAMAGIPDPPEEIEAVTA